MEHDKQAEEDHEEVEEDECPSSCVCVVLMCYAIQNFFVWLSIFDVLLCKDQRKFCPKYSRNAAQFFL